MKLLSYRRYRTKERFTHYLFRFPAKFHPPVARRLLDLYTREGDLVLDPFCGSGTILVEALMMDRPAIGVDVDPVAVFVSRAKARPIADSRLTKELSVVMSAIQPLRRSDTEYNRLMFDDLTDSVVEKYRTKFNIPQIPNIHHWFRNYVVIDLARLRMAIMGVSISPDVRRFLMACFASIIRGASNADPVPVSGLEVTAHMRKRDQAGRLIDPFTLFEQKALQQTGGMAELWQKASAARVHVRRGDATSLKRVIRPGTVDVVITSPPYNTAVDYYRRHTLEMYWLGLVRTHEERLRIAPSYLGRASVRVGSRRLREELEDDYLARLLRHADGLSQARCRALKHYAVSMRRTLNGLAEALRPSGKAVVVVGNAKWNGRRVRPTKLLEVLAYKHFKIVDRLRYRTHNRYMSYSRHNGADVSHEYVLVLQRR